MPVPKHLEVSRRQILAFRLSTQHLCERLSRADLLDAAGACGLQNTPPGSALLAASARIEGLRAEDLEHALTGNKSLLQSWSLRAAPHIFPTTDATVFTRALLPPDEDGLRFFIRGAVLIVEKIDLSLTRLVELCGAALDETLAGREMNKDELGREMAALALPRLTPAQAEAWQSSSWIAGQSLGETAARFALYVHALEGRVCLAERAAGKAFLRLTKEWLGREVADGGPGNPAELARRYLRCYGPSRADDFAAWAGISPAQARAMWNLVADELAFVRFEGRDLAALAGDLPHLLGSEMPSEARLLPPHDPYLNQRDRTILLPDKALHRRVWQASGNPGGLLLDGELAGVWRPTKSESKLLLKMEPFGDISSGNRARILREAERLAGLRGAATIKVRYDST